MTRREGRESRLGRDGKPADSAVPHALLVLASILSDIARESTSEDRAAAVPKTVGEEANAEGESQ